MFYLASKLLLWLLQPLFLVFLGLLAALVCFRSTRPALGKSIVAVCAAAIFIVGMSPLATVLLLILEERIPRPKLADDAPVAGIVVLGGAEQSRIVAARGVIAFSDAGERMTEGLALARRFPTARLVFTSGATEIVSNATNGADAAAVFYRDQGFDMRRLILERASRNTHENAVLTHALVGPKPGEIWILVTSASHMPRSLGVFRAIGWDVVPWPVDYRTEGWSEAWGIELNPTEGFRRMEMVAKEWVGMVAYRMTGRTRELFPGPKP